MAAKTPFIMTIDGPGGSGKDTLADQLLAEYFQPYRCVIANTGYFSRHIAYQTITNGKKPNETGFREFAIDCMDQMDFFKIDPDPLFSAEVEKVVSSVAAIPEIVAGFKERMPVFVAEEKDQDVFIILGRITASVFPEANVNLYLETSPDICAHRRALSRSKKGADYDTVFRDLCERNKNDLVNWNKNAEFPEGMCVINTDNQNPQQVYNKVIATKLAPALSLWI